MIQNFWTALPPSARIIGCANIYQRQNLRPSAFQLTDVLMSLFVHCTNQNEIRDSSKLHACLPISFHNCRVHVLALLPSHRCHSARWMPSAGATVYHGCLQLGKFFLLSVGTDLVWGTRRQSTFVGLWKMGLLCSATSLKSSFWQRQGRGRHEDRTTENMWGGHRSGSWHPGGGKQSLTTDTLQTPKALTSVNTS